MLENRHSKRRMSITTSSKFIDLPKISSKTKIGSRGVHSEEKHLPKALQNQVEIQRESHPVIEELLGMSPNPEWTATKFLTSVNFSLIPRANAPARTCELTSIEAPMRWRGFRCPKSP